LDRLAVFEQIQALLSRQTGDQMILRLNEILLFPALLLDMG
jgi:hypothetical protein